MGFRDGAYATVWEITNHGTNFTKIRISISRKDKRNDGEYITDFSGFASLIGTAHEKFGLIEHALENGNGRCRIKINACDVSNRYDKEEKREYVNFTIFDFDVASDKPSDSNSSTKPSPGDVANGRGRESPPMEGRYEESYGGDDPDDDGDLPF